MPVCGNYLFFELPKKIVLNPKDGSHLCHLVYDLYFCDTARAASYCVMLFGKFQSVR